MAATRTQLKWSPHWRLDQGDEGELILCAGADRRLQLQGIDDEQRDAALRWASEGANISIEPTEGRLADQLVAVGALVPTPSGASVNIVGDEVVAAKLASAMEAGPDGDGLAILIRTGDHWPKPPGQAHLAVDISMHHTLVLGPYVVPGLTACTSCLETRMRRRWPQTPLPSQPAVQQHLHPIAELVRIQADLIHRGVSPLANATIAWDLEAGTTDRQSLLKCPGCSTCDQATSTGRLSLPWTEGHAT